MNYLKRQLLTIFLVAIASLTFGQKAEKTLVKSFNLKGNQVVTLDLPGNVEVKSWNNPLMRVQMTIGLRNGTGSILKSLITAGRYNLQSKTDDEGAFVVYSPGLERKVTVRGNELQENLVYTVFAPDDVQVVLLDSASTSVEDAKLPSSL